MVAYSRYCKAIKGLLFFNCLFYISLSVFAQSEKDSNSSISYHYKDFGGTGAALLFMPSLHDDFKLTPEWESFVKSFTCTNKVYAYERSYWYDQNLKNYGVKEQAEEIYQFINSLNVPKIILIGRSAATQEMIYLAENCPEEIKGLILLDQPSILPDDDLQEIKEFESKLFLAACDMGKKSVPISSARKWKPSFLETDSVQISIPTLLFKHSYLTSKPLFQFFLDGFLQEEYWDNYGQGMGKMESYCDSVAAVMKAYFMDLAGNEKKKKH